MIRFVFDEREAAQAAARVLRRHGEPMHRDKLVRILYYADRRALLEHGYPITGDRFINTPDGPALARILDLTASGASSNSPWFQHVAPVRGSHLCAASDDEGALSEAVLGVLDQTHASLAAVSVSDICMRSRQLPEWRDIDGTHIPVIVDDIFRAEGLSHLAIIDIAEKAAAAAAIRSLGCS